MTDSAGCQCGGPAAGERTFFCRRHNLKKTAHWWSLCRSRDDYFRAWEEHRGPGQVPAALEMPQAPAMVCPLISGPCHHAALGRLTIFCRLDLPAIPGRCGQDKRARASAILAARLAGGAPPCPKARASNTAASGDR